MKILQTVRLILRPFELGDAAFYKELVNTPGWLKYIGDRNILTVEDAQNYLQNTIIPHFEQKGFGAFVMFNQQGEKTGMCGLFKRDYLEQPDIGYALLPEFEGRGYAGEAARAVLNWAFEDLNFTQIMAITNPDHERSQTLLAKIGLVYVKKIRLPADEVELCLFSTK